MFSLYVGLAVYGTPHGGSWVRLRFLGATVFSVCLGVASAVFSTRTTWLYVEAAGCECGGMLKVFFVSTRIAMIA